MIGASGEPAAVPVLIEAARHIGAKLTVVDDAAIDAVRELATSRLGTHQQRNAATACAAVQALERWVLRDRLQFVSLPPGRFEIVETETHDFILDGAHNPHAAHALAGELRARSLRPTVIAAVSSDKDVAGIAAALAPVARRVIATRYQQDRSLPPAELAAAFGTIECTPDLRRAIECATQPDADFVRTVIHPRPTILITGSLFLVGEARVQLLGAPADPYVVTDPAPRV